MVVVSGKSAFSKDMAVRKRISGIYNKRGQDFPSLKEYNDYLEELKKRKCLLALAVVNLVDGVDVPAIEARIAEYQRENADHVMNAQARKAEEYAAALAASKGNSRSRALIL
ncbi:cyclin-dependent kinase-activating kinase assembly factor-related / CDK-activating kinase assembly factor-related [Striga hermonthica]|uniref:Cyclin-dependent kinase-activating kinase assembly factor-related / CDK-activating kinase assembly factor-related n=1 Tax=Striga hermonthica TaxID=68872 RepID=A0A9N7R2D2_STRHE|nr:cyclin-dependent kinase-activating kinase assembly factor-related / CDK-activating kinase assembly factor-related [Striga hermonthica]